MNSPTRKYWIYALVIVVLGAIVFAFWEKDEPESESEETTETSDSFLLSGKAFGQDYSVNYWDEKTRNFQQQIDSLIQKWESVANASFPSSEVYRLNSFDTLSSPSRELISLLQEAQKWNNSSNGILDPTLEGLEKSWSFSSSGASLLDTLGIGEVMKKVGWGKIFRSDSLIQKPAAVDVNFSKFLSGFMVDKISDFLRRKGIPSFQIKLGKTEYATGVNLLGELWKSEIGYLTDTLGTLSTGEIAIKDLGSSSAGSPDQFYIRDSTRLSFTLDPRTGFPVTHSLLAVKVFSRNAEEADAWADLLMVLGKNEAMRLDSAQNNLQMILIYHEKGGRMRQYISPELKPYLSFPTDF
ncbi:thiamine biosynthesis lipoprotein ApbE [Algoriphagus boseongensis]|uniref:FAD:protein FMN transferase n=1 Tax=Algoriphagus boseongensis TaxID=1442587 RepID=A0A4R6T4V1_9BACT|nr:FAD:protein FMN transferase [Algoriphagus boseongensis]TDQ17343.1 thiamine biosynthesis lipoprotein ApbE [Algoriphagus boseongensis]